MKLKEHHFLIEKTNLNLLETLKDFPSKKEAGEGDFFIQKKATSDRLILKRNYSRLAGSLHYEISHHSVEKKISICCKIQLDLWSILSLVFLLFILCFFLLVTQSVLLFSSFFALLLLSFCLAYFASKLEIETLQREIEIRLYSRK